MSTYGAMQARISDDFINESITTSQIQNAIQSAIAFYQRRRFYFNETIATFSTVANQEYYTSTDLADIPNIVQIVALQGTLNNVMIPLRAVDWKFINTEQYGTLYAFPKQFAVYQEQIRLFPIPDQVYTMTIAYIDKFGTLSADADTNAWMTDAEELIRQSAKRRLALDILQADDIAQRCAVLEKEALDDLNAETRRRYPNTVLQVPAMITPNRFNIRVGY